MLLVGGDIPCVVKFFVRCSLPQPQHGHLVISLPVNFNIISSTDFFAIGELNLVPVSLLLNLNFVFLFLLPSIP
jgi:hypothetical protein